jgi:FtsH-binding integral membrane protein
MGWARRGMRSMRNRLGLVLLSVWLILQGLLPLLHVSFTGSGTVLNVLAIAAGVLLLLGY